MSFFLRSFSYLCPHHLAVTFFKIFIYLASSGFQGFPGGLDGKESAWNGRDPGLIPGLGKSDGEGNGYPLQYSCLENSMDRGAWRAIVHGVSKSQTDYLLEEAQISSIIVVYLLSCLPSTVRMATAREVKLLTVAKCLLTNRIVTSVFSHFVSFSPS